ncbi:hypothetical protein BGX38DRAFT_122812 [Terfezia claveryi]|nr:hypothetical protein BGX38DRAFT_122812 [Terfezia claveryi]
MYRYLNCMRFNTVFKSSSFRRYLSLVASELATEIWVAFPNIRIHWTHILESLSNFYTTWFNHGTFPASTSSPTRSPDMSPQVIVNIDTNLDKRGYSYSQYSMQLRPCPHQTTQCHRYRYTWPCKPYGKFRCPVPQRRQKDIPLKVNNDLASPPGGYRAGV